MINGSNLRESSDARTRRIVFTRKAVRRGRDVDAGAEQGGESKGGSRRGG